MRRLLGNDHIIYQNLHLDQALSPNDLPHSVGNAVDLGTLISTVSAINVPVSGHLPLDTVSPVAMHTPPGHKGIEQILVQEDLGEMRITTGVTVTTTTPLSTTSTLRPGVLRGINRG